jgi:hypothetical protein
VLSSLWGAIAAGDPLRAELETSTCMAIPHVAGQRDPAETESFVSTVLVNEAIRRQTPDGAAMLRTLMSLGTPAIRKTASRALGELTGGGIYPPEWVTEIGKVTPGQAWRRYDIFGDDETVAATFSYGETEHAVVMQVDLTGIPITTAIGVASNAASLVDAVKHVDDDEFDRAEQIDLTEARRRMEEPLARCEEESDPGLSADTVAYLPIARTRIRRLPAEPVYCSRRLHRGRPRGRGRRLHEEPAGRRRRRGRRGVDAILGRGAHRLQQPDFRRAADAGRPAQARAHPAGPRGHRLHFVPGTAPAPRARGDRVGALVRRAAEPGRGADGAPDRAAAQRVQPVRRGV